jgi:Protein of unknown function (DUF4232)
MSAGGPASGDPAEAPLCEAADLAVTVRWEREGTGLRGQVLAENVGGRVCRLAGKPAVTPLAGDGTPLPAQTVSTLEWRSPGYVLLRPGQRAAARVFWASWCGRRAAGRARVGWEGGEAVAEVHGPAQPECSPGAPGNLVSSWFEPIG